MATVTKDLGVATAYGYHKAGGGTLTEAQFEQKMVDITTAADDAEASASDAEAYGAGTRGGTAVSSTDGAYQNNAKYYKEQAQQTAQSLSESTQQIAANTSDIADLKEDLSVYAGVSFFDIATSGYIKTNISAGNTVDLTPVSNNAFVHAVIDVTPNSIVTLNGTGWTTGRLWAFIDANNRMLAVATNNVVAENLEIVAPENASKCIVNMYKTTVGVNYIGIKAVKIDETLTESGKAADAQKVGALTKYIEEPYSKIEQGGVDLTTGRIANTSTAVRTALEHVRSVKKLVKPIGYGISCACYDLHGIYLGYFNVASTVAYAIDDFGAIVINRYSDTAFVRLRFKKYDNGTETNVTPEDFYTDGNSIMWNKTYVWDYATSQIEGSYIFENITLDSGIEFDIPNSKNFYKNLIVTVDATADLSDENSPCTIQLTRRWASPTGEITNAYYGSPQYPLGGNGIREQHQYRFPCGIYGMSDYRVAITIPSGSALKIHSMSFDYNNAINRHAYIQLNAHGQCGFGGPSNTSLAFITSAKLGYKYCITIPKVTSDGVYVCFHDDDNVQGTLRNPDGTAISSEYQDKPISTFTYEELMTFDAGVVRGQIFKGEKVPLLADFFKICAETGMHPMLSVHPSLEGHWNNIKALAKKYNVLQVLNIKAPMGDTLTAPMSVLLNDIESYTVDINSETSQAVAYMDNLKETYNIDTSKTKMGIEYFTAYATDDKITNALNAGYFVSIANITSGIYNAYKGYIEKGVTQFTDDYMPCVGLRWC